MQRNKYAEVVYREYCDVLTKNFRSYLEQELYIDVMFLCKNHKKVPAHQIVLGSFSSLLHELFSDHQKYFKGHVAYICLPDMKASSLQNILQFIYYGKVSLKNKKDLALLYEDLVLLDLPSNVIVSETDPGCSYITGTRRLNASTQSANEDDSSLTPRNTVPGHPDNRTTNDNCESGPETAANSPDGVSSSSSSLSSALPVISSVITLVTDSEITVGNADQQKNTRKVVVPPLTDTLPNEKRDVTEQQILVSSSEDSSREKQPNAQKLDVISNKQSTSTFNEADSTKKKNDLLAVLKKVTIACQNLESVGVSDDESTRTNLQSCVRIVKQCIVDINDMLSSEVSVNSQGSYKFIDVEKDWELKIMLDNCLQTLPRLEKAIENSHNKGSKGRRHRRKERHESIDRLDHQCQKVTCNESIANK